MIDAEFGESRVVRSNILFYVAFASVMVLAIVALLIYFSCKCCKCIQTIAEKVWRAVFFNIMLRTVFETQLEVTIKNMIKLLMLNEESTYEKVESSVAIGTLSALFLLAVTIPCFLNCKKDVLETKQFDTKYGSLMQDLRKRSRPSRFYYTLFM